MNYVLLATYDDAIMNKIFLLMRHATADIMRKAKGDTLLLTPTFPRINLVALCATFFADNAGRGG
jgi:hypothetical protein